MKGKISIAVIDSGIHVDSDFQNIDICGCGVQKNDIGDYQIVDDFDDRIGHGTAVVDELLKGNGSINDIYCIRIYESSMDTDVQALLYALQFVEKNLQCDIILISSGVTYIEFYQELKTIVDKITEQGKIIVSALDNEGSISYPAAFENVIGVAEIQNVTEKIGIRANGYINVMMPKNFYRLKWIEPSKIIIGGSSFAAAKVAMVCTKILYEHNKNITRHEMLQLLARELNLKFEEGIKPRDNSWKQGKAFVKTIKKAIVFPWNKEIHALARFSDLLSFEIVGFYDTKYGMNIGKEVGGLLGIHEKIGRIENFDKIDWDAEFDTVICGHCMELSNLLHRDLLQEILEKCYKYQKKIYAFDREWNNFKKEGNTFASINCFVPGIQQLDCALLTDTRLCNRLTPAVGIFGTSSQQGKFTVQMELRRQFLQQGYEVGQICTEPSGYLFGCDAVFPFGYNANIFTDAENSVRILNQMMWETSEYNEKEVILVGGQSGVVPYSHENLCQYNFKEYEFLCGVNPDAFVLCVNPHDPVDYIKRSIQYLNSFNGMPVVAIVLFPLIYEASNQLGYGYKKRHITEIEKQDISKLIHKETGIPVYSLEEKCDMEEMFNRIIDALCEE